MNKPQIYIDADGCPVKDEVYKVAGRHQIRSFVVANKYMNVPLSPLIEMVTVPGAFDAADDWIAEHVQKNDIVITGDIPLADRALKKFARVADHKGNEFTHDSIGEAMATRELMQNLRHMGEVRGGPAPMTKQDKSKFLSKLEQLVQAALRSTSVS
jgi:uncharacterized protein